MHIDVTDAWVSRSLYCYDAEGVAIHHIAAFDTETKTALRWQDPGGHSLQAIPQSEPVQVASFEFVVPNSETKRKLLTKLPTNLHHLARIGNKATFTRIIRNGPGHSRREIHCVCGQRNYFYAWSWAGHGKARCRGCQGWIKYLTLEVVYD